MVLLGGITVGHADLHNVFMAGKVNARTAKLQSCTLADGIRCEKEEHTLLDSILSHVEAVQGGARIEHCNVFGKASDGGDIGVRYTPEMLEILKKALDLGKKGIIKF